MIIEVSTYTDEDELVECKFDVWLPGGDDTPQATFVEGWKDGPALREDLYDTAWLRRAGIYDELVEAACAKYDPVLDSELADIEKGDNALDLARELD